MTPALNPSPAPPAGLTVSGLDQHYGSAQVLRTVGFHVAPGTCLAVLGRNGAGKTTLMRTATGALPPTAGTVRLGDLGTRHLDDVGDTGRDRAADEPARPGARAAPDDPRRQPRAEPHLRADAGGRDAHLCETGGRAGDAFAARAGREMAADGLRIVREIVSLLGWNAHLPHRPAPGPRGVRGSGS